MSTYKSSVLTSDIERNPSILDRIRGHAAHIGCSAVTVTEHGAVTTVTAVGA
jgi:hypothetical protein